MAKLTNIRGCGPMVCSDYHEISAAIDQAHAGPRHEPMQWRNVAAQLEAGVARKANPLADLTALRLVDANSVEPLAPSPDDLTPG
ncbi:MAG: hypothetical protein JNK23_08475 [Opitutaceae bacterium]|nr:hypothetical protein [Opitutaceae bacterium]